MPIHTGSCKLNCKIMTTTTPTLSQQFQNLIDTLQRGKIDTPNIEIPKIP
jgi:hypothetical protein